jgi:protein O-GlcNAc transferase
VAATSAEQLAAAAWRFHQMGRLAEAIDLYRQAARLAPGYAEIHNNLGNALRAAGKLEDAATSLSRAVKLKPGIAAAHSNLGLILAELGQLEEAAQSHRRALALQPNLALAHNNLGIALLELGRTREAEAAFRRALELQGDLPEAHANLGDALRLSERQQEAPEAQARCLLDAVESYRRAIALNPGFAEAHANLGEAQSRLGELAAAAVSFKRAWGLKPGYGQAFAQYVSKMHAMCDWRDTSPIAPVFAQLAGSNDKGALAFPLLSIVDDPVLQLEVARHDSRVLADVRSPALWRGQKYRHQKIRLAYLSADFQEHAVAYLVAGLFEIHDRERFEIFAFSFGPDDHSAMRGRLARSFDHFFDVAALSDSEVAGKLRECEIDIAVDLMGHTRLARPRILAYRPAPIQVNYLGYPGSMGAPFIDYAIVDPFVVPQAQQVNFDEKLVYLPHSYQANDSQRAIADQTPSRTDCGLPENGFVFCCFNNNHKILPEMFSIWMELLARVSGSVLWLLADNRWAVDNLRREAGARGIDPGRLIFAGRARHADHLARHRLADLFLDTLPYNAHTTASDALWAGLPVLTCAGTGFQARVAGSLLRAVGLPGLVTDNLGDYKAKAVGLALRPEELREVRDNLARNRATAPLFDTGRLRRDIESVYTQMWKRWQEGISPRSFAVPLAD